MKSPRTSADGILKGINRNFGRKFANTGTAVSPRRHGDYQIKMFTRQIPVRIGSAYQVIESIEIPLLNAHHCNEYLSENVERRTDRPYGFDIPFRDRAGTCRGMQYIDRGNRKEGCPAPKSHAVAGASDSLRRGRKRIRCLDQDDFIQVSDIDAHLQ